MISKLEKNIEEQTRTISALSVQLDAVKTEQTKNVQMINSKVKFIPRDSMYGFTDIMLICLIGY